jgi:hypothetical protein
VNPHEVPLLAGGVRCARSVPAIGGSVPVIDGPDHQRLRPANDLQGLGPQLHARALTPLIRLADPSCPGAVCEPLREFVGRRGAVVVSNPGKPRKNRGQNTQGDTRDAPQTTTRNGSEPAQRRCAGSLFKQPPWVGGPSCLAPFWTPPDWRFGPPAGGSPAPCGLRLRAPVGVFFWAASLAPPTINRRNNKCLRTSTES